jgi:hypothetical protein
MIIAEQVLEPSIIATDKKEKKKVKSKKMIELLSPSRSAAKEPTSAYKKKTKGAKLIEAFVPEIITNVKPINIILQLKCSIREIDEYIHKSNWKFQNVSYNPTVPMDIQAYEDNSLHKSFGNYSSSIVTEIPVLNIPENPNKSTETNSNDTNNSKCACCLSKESDEKNVLNEIEIQKIKQLKIAFYKNEMQDKKADCFWCSYSYDNDPCYILQYGYNNEIYGHGSFCSPECGVAFLFGKQSTWDDSAKTEAYQLMNYYYGKPNGFQQSIKPALSPYYFLDKFYGNLTIQEYRKLTKSNHMMLIVDKPVTRILPEIHEDNDQIFSGNNYGNTGNGNVSNSGSGGKYKVKKQSEKPPGQTRNNILREQFGLGRIDSRD